MPSRLAGRLIVKRNRPLHLQSNGLLLFCHQDILRYFTGSRISTTVFLSQENFISAFEW